ncbi:hypothetical protein ACFWU5_26450 [Nocardia sp. NPDC058640]|uniref:hypothetical protein n=1 Tax=Nocardia sp. NPDC058640 TaxID=3346571 RepID=UPI00366496D6
MHRRMIRILLATTAIAGIATAGAAPALAAPARPAAMAGTGSAAIDVPLAIINILLCGPYAGAEPHPTPACR